MRISDWSSDVCSSDLCRSTGASWSWSAVTGWKRWPGPSCGTSGLGDAAPRPALGTSDGRTTRPAPARLIQVNMPPPATGEDGAPVWGERVMEPKSVQITRRLWWGLGALLVVSFGIMLWIGKDIYQTAPPMPEQVVTQSGQVVYTRDDIEVGRSVWQSIGGQQNGSIWGHGALIAPDWSAEWLHLEVMAMLELRARSAFGLAYDALEDKNGRASCRERVCQYV